MLNIEEEEENINVNDHIAIENVFPESHCVFGVQAELLQAVPLHEVLTMFEDKIALCGMKPLLNEEGNMQLYMLAYGSPTGDIPNDKEQDKNESN